MIPRASLFLLLSLGCTTWRASSKSEWIVPKPERMTLLVVTKEHIAFELEDARSDGETIKGTPISVWRVPPESLSRLDQSGPPPYELAGELGWTWVPDRLGLSSTSIEVGDVLYARVLESTELAKVGPAVVAVVAGALLLGVGSLSLIFILGGIPGGRPFRIRGRRVITPVQGGGDWTHAIEVRPVPEKIRSALADIWTEEARAEHASVAAFSKLSLELLALAAPPDLVLRANRAAIQEVQHARLCFALASAYSGKPLGPGPLSDALSGDTLDIERIARESLVDGCMGEGISAEFARRGAEQAEDPQVAKVLSTLARDEAQHEALAWSIVDWCLAREGEPLRRTLLAVLVEASLPTSAHLPLHGRVGSTTVSPYFERLRSEARARLS